MQKFQVFFLPGGKIKATKLLGKPFIKVSSPFLTFCANSLAVCGRLFPPLAWSKWAKLPLWMQANLHRSFWPISTTTSCNVQKIICNFAIFTWKKCQLTFQSSRKSASAFRLIREINCSAWDCKSFESAKLVATLNPSGPLSFDPLPVKEIIESQRNGAKF